MRDASSKYPSFASERTALLIIAMFGIVGYALFPDDLGFLARMIGLALLVLSLDLVTGYCGVATLGQATIFGVSAYAVGNACIQGLTDPLLLLVVGMVTGTLVGAISGGLITRFSDLPQLVISIALGQLVAALANKLSHVTGGSDGLAGISSGPVFGIFEFDLYSRTSFGFSLAVLAAIFVLLLRFVHSPFGLMCRAIKDDPLRARMIGAAVYPRLIAMYAVSGAVAGAGGALTAINTGVVGLDSVSFERSAEALVMLVLGGAGNLWGALVGTLVFQVLEHVVGAANPFQWMTIIGALLIAIVVFTPRGLFRGVELAWGLVGRWRSVR